MSSIYPDWANNCASLAHRLQLRGLPSSILTDAMGVVMGSPLDLLVLLLIGLWLAGWLIWPILGTLIHLLLVVIIILVALRLGKETRV